MAKQKGNPEQQIRDAIRDFVKSMLSDNTVQAEVKSVNKTDKTITAIVEKDKLEVFNVRLMALVADEAGDGITIFPKVGSTVLIGQIEENNTSYYVCQYSVIESYEIKVEGIKFFMDKDGVKFNDGNNAGLVKHNPLKLGLDKNNLILQAIKTAASVPVTEPGNGAPSAFQAALNTAISSLTLGDFSGLENDKVKQ